MDNNIDKALKYAKDTNRLENNSLDDEELNEIMDSIEKDNDEEFVSSVTNIINKGDKKEENVKAR